MSNYHVPVMLDECMEGLNIKPNGVYVDVTYGGGGHSKEILNRLGEDGLLLAFDQDSDAVKNKADDKRLVFCNANFEFLQNFCEYYNVKELDGVLADLGVSSHHFNEADRGFSYRFDNVELDMRMNNSAKLSAAQVLNQYDYHELFRVLKTYGELPKASHMANSIITYRGSSKIKTTTDLENALKDYINPSNKNKQLAKVYQAIRIEVNQEMEALESMLEQAVTLLKPSGRLVVMSYHSLEDRMVKNLLQNGNVAGERITDEFGVQQKSLTAVVKKPIIPSDAEMKSNSRARSAKLRIGEKN